MKRYILDTHALIWFLDGDSRLGNAAKNALQEPDSIIIIPSIVLAELKFLLLKKISQPTFTKILRFIENNPRCTIYPLDLNVIEFLPTNLDIHDAIIVATTVLFAKTYPDETKLITKDTKIEDSKLVSTIW